MTPCNNCHGGEGTRPSRNELEWLTREPALGPEGGRNGSDATATVPPDIACPARPHWPERLARDRDLLPAFSWWVRENYRETLRAARPGVRPYFVDVQDASLGLSLGLRDFTYNGSRREDFHSWSTYTTDVHAAPGGRLELRLEAEGNELPLERGLLALHGVSVDGPYFVNLSGVSRQAIFESDGDLCLLPQSLLADPRHGLLASPHPHYTGGIALYPEIFNLGGGAGVSANLCLPLPTEFRSPAISEAPPPRTYELNDLLGRIQNYRENHPPRPPGSESWLQRLFLGSGRRLQSLFELVQTGSELNLELRDLQDLFLPGMLDLGPSRLGLRAVVTPEREVEATLTPLSLVFQAMGYGRDPDTEEPRLLLDSARLTGPAEGPALRLRLDPVARELRSLEAQVSLEAVVSLLRPAWRGLGLSGNLRLALHDAGRWAFGLSDLSVTVPELRLSLGDAEAGAEPAVLSGALRGGETPRALLGVTIPPGLRGAFDPAAGELHLEGNLVLSAELRGPRGNFELRAPLAFFTTLRLGAGGPAPIPGSTALSIEGLELIDASSRRELFRDGELFFSDDPDQDIFREGRVLEGFSLNDATLARHRSLPATVELRGVWENHHRVDLRGHLPLPLRDAEPRAYDFSALLEDAAELHLDLFDLNPAPAPGGARAPAFNLIGGVLRAQRFAEADGRTLWDFRLEGEAFSLGRRGGLVYLRQPRLEAELDRLELQAGNLLVRIPLLDLRANERGSPAGRLRGPIHVHLNGTERGGLEVELDSERRPTALRNLDLAFNLQGLDVLPPRLRRNLPGGARFVGLDGHLEGNFRMNYPEDPRHWNGRGALRLRGDRDGDVYLLDSRLRRVGPPLIRDTRWRWDRVDGVDRRRGYALGDFHLELLLNPMPLLGSVEAASRGLEVAFGGDGRRLRPGEIWAEMPYDNQPWTPRGFRNRIVDYLEALCRQSPGCRP